MTHELIKTAYYLVRAAEIGKPRQSDLKRALSTAYYALFHTLARECADRLIGTHSPQRSAAWKQVYRALDHGFAKQACSQAKKLGFPSDIVHFADTLQRSPH